MNEGAPWAPLVAHIAGVCIEWVIKGRENQPPIYGHWNVLAYVYVGYAGVAGVAGYNR
jgi:hypothetical protein